MLAYQNTFRPVKLRLAQAAGPVTREPSTTDVWVGNLASRMAFSGLLGIFGLVVSLGNKVFYPDIARGFTRKQGTYEALLGAAVTLSASTFPVSGKVVDYVAGAGGALVGIGLAAAILPRKASRTRKGK